MTDKEKAIVMAHTGICMLTGEKYGVFHKYIEDILGRPVYTHELAMQSISDEIKEKSRDDFIKLCMEEQEPCEDAISREDALMCLTGEIKETDTIETIIARFARRIRKLPPVNPAKTGHCKDCKWWKDSNGTYRRGVHAESKCPINRKEVYEGNGYCYMFEPKERSDKEC